jgi:hypothetical protein
MKTIPGRTIKPNFKRGFVRKSKIKGGFINPVLGRKGKGKWSSESMKNYLYDASRNNY